MMRLLVVSISLFLCVRRAKPFVLFLMRVAMKNLIFRVTLVIFLFTLSVILRRRLRSYV